MIVYPSPFPLAERPLACILGRHKWRLHPSSGPVYDDATQAPSTTDIMRGMYCDRCHTERWTRTTNR